jgi:hypothetical protein
MNKSEILKIYSLNQPFISSEWRAIEGDKYRHALPFEIVLTDDIEEAQVIAWDGVISLKLKRLVPEIKNYFNQGKVLLLMGESQSLFKNHALVELFNFKDYKIVELTGWSVLPEDILAALEQCHQKFKNV